MLKTFLFHVVAVSFLVTNVLAQYGDIQKKYVGTGHELIGTYRPDEQGRYMLEQIDGYVDDATLSYYLQTFGGIQIGPQLIPNMMGYPAFYPTPFYPPENAQPVSQKVNSGTYVPVYGKMQSDGQIQSNLIKNQRDFHHGNTQPTDSTVRTINQRGMIYGNTQPTVNSQVEINENNNQKTSYHGNNEAIGSTVGTNNQPGNTNGNVKTTHHGNAETVGHTGDRSKQKHSVYGNVESGVNSQLDVAVTQKSLRHTTLQSTRGVGVNYYQRSLAPGNIQTIGEAQENTNFRGHINIQPSGNNCFSHKS